MVTQLQYGKSNMFNVICLLHTAKTLQQYFLKNSKSENFNTWILQNVQTMFSMIFTLCRTIMKNHFFFFHRLGYNSHKNCKSLLMYRNIWKMQHP